MSSEKVTIEATIAVEPKKAWDVWNKPEHITKWNFADPSWHCPSATNDLRVGGKYSARMEAKDGSFGFEFECIYDEVVDQKKIAYTMGDGRKVVTTFEDLGGKTKVKTVFDAEKQNPVEMQKGGWQAILNNYKAYAESF